jgi:hypothetical protein
MAAETVTSGNTMIEVVRCGCKLDEELFSPLPEGI